MTEKEQKAYRQGFENGSRAVQNSYSAAIKIGNAILEVMYEKFKLAEEDD